MGIIIRITLLMATGFLAWYGSTHNNHDVTLLLKQAWFAVLLLCLAAFLNILFFWLAVTLVSRFLPDRWRGKTWNTYRLSANPFKKNNAIGILCDLAMFLFVFGVVYVCVIGVIKNRFSVVGFIFLIEGIMTFVWYLLVRKVLAFKFR